jgi:hypothetical protein
MVGTVREAKDVAKTKAVSEQAAQRVEREAGTGRPAARPGTGLRARRFRVCGTVLVLLAVAGLVAMTAAPLLLALTR